MTYLIRQTVWCYESLWYIFFLFSFIVTYRHLISVAYLLGLLILGYSLDIRKEHTNLIDQRLEKLIYIDQLDAKELDKLAGLAAEGLEYDTVVGQSADLFSLQVVLDLIHFCCQQKKIKLFNSVVLFLQRFINRSKPTLSKEQQQNLTRWAVRQNSFNLFSLAY